MSRKLLTLSEARTIAENQATKYHKPFHVISYSGNPCVVVTEEGMSLISRGGRVAVEILYSTSQEETPQTSEEAPQLSLVGE